MSLAAGRVTLELALVVEGLSLQADGQKQVPVDTVSMKNIVFTRLEE